MRRWNSWTFLRHKAADTEQPFPQLEQAFELPSVFLTVQYSVLLGSGGYGRAPIIDESAPNATSEPEYKTSSYFEPRPLFRSGYFGDV
ncbi:uncharacterized protein VDAG_06297 [Verticillium dahliae VdLs.17]|uniref:Uncharacterized protein n=1 Tax=Verticillium dahliae (strain VdLs.17 / ATCC MYA-4575 / FGSC 10137) TaxID=498257 RepID=G2X739_VERDV|nr:uncharacterized protein VDAG_06297 [Verticillium dahliae VdLs.17]EGY14807.1 hypothetical protein VDAG_06297 [Verticillium dahliae VdLs.17]